MLSSCRTIERRLLQGCVAVLALVPAGAGLDGVIGGAAMVADAAGGPVSLDSHVRYLSGLLLAIGIGFWSCVPGIERKGARFALLSAIVFCGGLARLLGVILDGWPSAAMCFGLAMELAVTPGLFFWQRRLRMKKVFAA